VFLHIGGLLLDATPEQIQKVMNLYNRPGTPGEKQAAEAALRRMGVDLPRERAAAAYASRSKKYEVEVNFAQGGRWTWEGEAFDELDAERQAREYLKKYFKKGAKIPQYQMQRARRI
jgi:hypothetical protein